MRSNTSMMSKMADIEGIGNLVSSNTMPEGLQTFFQKISTHIMLYI